MKALLFAPLLLAACSAPMQPPSMEAGFLCCNMRTDGEWISDSNYVASDKHVLPFGTQVKVIGYAEYRVKVDINGRPQSLGNDYSRDLSMDAFARRYVVEKDPRQALAELPPKIQRAMQTMRVTKGMTREQVIVAIGYPITSETPHLDLNKWRYWLGTFTPFTVNFDSEDKVAGVTTDPETLVKVFIE